MSRLRIQGLEYRYGKKQALDGVGFEIGAGQFCALLGPNGAGKSTLFGLLTRLLLPQAGTVEIAGINLSLQPRSALARFGIVFQQSTLDLDLTVRQNLRYFAALHGLSGRDRDERIDAALDRLDMRHRAGEKARNLNGGHRRRTEIARALLHRPSVLLLDEPTVGLDAQTRASITDHVHSLAEEGTSILWATHLADEVRDRDRLVVLHQGRVLANDTAGAVRGDKTLSDAFLALTGPPV